MKSISWFDGPYSHQSHERQPPLRKILVKWDEYPPQNPPRCLPGERACEGFAARFENSLPSTKNSLPFDRISLVIVHREFAASRCGSDIK
jgi:hypothetical protein